MDSDTNPADPQSIEAPMASVPDPPPTEGMYFGLALDRAGGAQSLDVAEVRAWSPERDALWVVLDRNYDGAEEWLEKTFQLSEVVREGMLAEDTRPRCVRTTEGMLILMRGVNLNPGATPDDMVRIRLWVDEHKAISLRNRRVFALRDLQHRLEQGVGPRTPGEVLVQLADAITDRIRDVVNNQQDLVDEIDEAMLERVTPDLRRKLASPRRQAMTIRRYLAPQRDMIARLAIEPTPLLTDGDRLRLRETADELTRQVEELDLLRERASLIQEQMAATASEQMNRTMYVLSLVAAIFLPLGLITGLLGVNVGGIPGADSPWAFAGLCVIMVGLAIVEYFFFRKMRWL